MTTIAKIDAMPSVVNATEGVDYNILDGEPVLGDAVRITTLTGMVFFEGHYTPKAVPEPSPVVLSDLEFIRHAAANIAGGGGRVTTIIEGFRDHSSPDLRYAYQEYDKATVFTKKVVSEFLTAGVAGGILSEAERAAVLDGWPT